MTDIVERLRLLVPSDPSGSSIDAIAEIKRLRAALNTAVDVFYEMANLLNDEDFAGEVPGLSGKVIGHRERYHKHMVEELSKAGDAALAALKGT